MNRHLLRLLGAAVIAGQLVGRPVSAAVLDYATYLGGTGDEAQVYFEGEVHLARDGAGNLYLTGTTRSPDFPTTAGVFSRTLGGEADVFVTKLSPDGAVLYSTYLGGPCEDFARAIAVDGAGNAYVTGQVNGGGLCTAQPGVLVAKLDPSGGLVYASRIGGSLLDASSGSGIAVDGDGQAYVTGSAVTSDFPTTDGAYRTTPCPNVYPFAGDAFVAKVSADGTSLVYSTLVCGQGDDAPASIAIDDEGNAYVAGATTSSDFPLVDPIERVRGGGEIGISGFVFKLGADGGRLVYSTYLGGSGSALVNDIALDPGRNAYVTGETSSIDFPTTPGVLQERAGKRHCIAGCTDAFVSKIAPSGSALVWSTYLYGELDDTGHAIAVDGAGNTYVAGQTVSLLFPIREAFQHADRGLDDAFVVKISPDGSRLLYSSYLGGSRAGESPATGSDSGTDLALDAGGNAYVTGYTQSFDLPTTADSPQPRLAAGLCDVLGTACGDAFVARITPLGTGPMPAVTIAVDTTAVAPGGTLVATWAGNPTPSSRDYLRLFALGSAGDEFDDPVIAWSTPDAAAGRLALMVPADLPPGWYELRLLSPDLGSGLPVPIARSEPIHVGGPLPPPPPGGTCDGAACDGGDPCAGDACGPTCGPPAQGPGSVLCTCARAALAACGAESIPRAIDERRRGICDVFAQPPTARRLRKAVRMLRGSIRAVSTARRKGVSAACAGALRQDLRDARDRARAALGGAERH
jgi:beta-propeller repeat-containing protein